MHRWSTRFLSASSSAGWKWKLQVRISWINIPLLFEFFFVLGWTVAILPEYIKYNLKCIRCKCLWQNKVYRTGMFSSLQGYCLLFKLFLLIVLRKIRQSSVAWISVQLQSSLTDNLFNLPRMLQHFNMLKLHWTFTLAINQHREVGGV